jgi:ubiquitin-conjugating enzyme E2 Q
MSEEEDFDEEILICADDDDLSGGDELESVSVSSLRPSLTGTQKTSPTDVETPALIARFNPSGPSANRLIYDVKEMRKSNPNEVGFTAAPKGDDLFLWEIRFFGFPAGSPTALDFKQYTETTKRNYMELEAIFPPTYPMHPPFIRVIQPRFQKGGIITTGGSICTDVLTMEAWSPSYDIQGLILNVLSAVCAYKPRIDFETTVAYSIEQAKKSFRWTAKYHSWPLPPGF